MRYVSCRACIEASNIHLASSSNVEDVPREPRSGVLSLDCPVQKWHEEVMIAHPVSGACLQESRCISRRLGIDRIDLDLNHGSRPGQTVEQTGGVMAPHAVIG